MAETRVRNLPHQKHPPPPPRGLDILTNVGCWFPAPISAPAPLSASTFSSPSPRERKSNNAPPVAGAAPPPPSAEFPVKLQPVNVGDAKRIAAAPP